MDCHTMLGGFEIEWSVELENVSVSYLLTFYVCVSIIL
jgi:hypothetical protein